MSYALLLSLSLLSCGGAHDEHEHDEQGHDEHGPAEEGEHSEEAPSVGGALHVSPDLQRDLRISTVTAGAAAAAERVVALGELRPHEDAVAAAASPVSARVVRVTAATGERVQVGAPLVELESVEVGQARASLVAAQAHRVRARAALERKLGLGEVVSAAELDAARADASVAEVELLAAEAALSALGVGVALPNPIDGRFVLRAPINGRVLSRAASPGAVVDVEEILFRLADLDRLQVEAHVFERDAVRIQPGAHADVSLSALPGVSFPATVERVGAEVDAISRTVAIRMDLEPDPRLKPGMAATASADADAPGGGVVTVPAAALQRFGGGWVLFLPRGEEQFEIRAVGRGRDLGSSVEIVSGLAAGETVVLDGAFLLKAEAEKRQGGGEGHHDH